MYWHCKGVELVLPQTYKDQTQCIRLFERVYDFEVILRSQKTMMMRTVEHLRPFISNVSGYLSDNTKYAYFTTLSQIKDDFFYFHNATKILFPDVDYYSISLDKFAIQMEIDRDIIEDVIHQDKFDSFVGFTTEDYHELIRKMDICHDHNQLRGMADFFKDKEMWRGHEAAMQWIASNEDL